MKKREIIDKLTENAKEVLSNAYTFAEETGSPQVLIEHIFIALLSLEKGLAARFLKSLGIDVEKTIQGIKERFKQSKVKEKEVLVSEEVKELIKSAFLLAHELGHVYVGTEHLLLALLKYQDREFVKEFAGLDFNSVKERLLTYATYAPGIFAKGEVKQEKSSEAVSYFARNLNDLARKGKLMPIIGREKEIGRLIRILARHTKNNPILVGDPGVGKTAVVEGLVQKIIRGDVPESLKKMEIYQVDLASILAGSKVRGDVEQRLLVLLSEITSSPNKVLFIDEIHMIVGAGATGPDRSMDVANILKPRLTDESIRIIGATTITEYRESFEEDAALSRRFQPIMVDEITPDDTIEILRGITPRLEEYHGVKIKREAIRDVVNLSDRYITDRFFPDKAIDVLDEAAAAEKLKREEECEGDGEILLKLTSMKKRKQKAFKEKNFDKALEYKAQEEELTGSLKKATKKKAALISKGNYKVESEDIKRVISEWTGIPVTTLSDEELQSLRDLKKRILKRIIGQNNAVNRVTATLKRARMGISDKNRPLASFLFLGPTGVGKTEMGKVVARELFGSEKALIQVDMSEYMEQHSVAKIIGAPPGYVGYQEGGQLTEKVKKQPYSVILFDEIEKAHHDLLGILLQIFEEGHITDSKGRKVNFRNTIIILTSNIGAEDIGKDRMLGFKIETDKRGSKARLKEAYERMRERLSDDLKKVLRPEFINRIDEIVIFRGLDENDAVKITKVLLKELQDRLKEKRVKINVSNAALRFIAKGGFSQEYGARNLRRKVQELIENPLSDLLLDSTKTISKVSIKKVGKKLKLIPS
jgi:ATP-dependent Clp protease ATP-binding subunit ClpC